MSKHDFKVGDIVLWEYSGLKERCKVVEKPPDSKRDDEDDHVWLLGLEEWSCPLSSFGGIEYLTLIEKAKKAPIDQDFDQRMREKVDTNLRGLFT